MGNIMDELSREVEQQEASTEAFANAVSLFWNNLRKQGLSRKEATELTSTWMQSVILSTLDNNKPDQ